MMTAETASAPPICHLSRAQRILVINKAPIGDVIMSTAALRMLRTALPQARITLIIPPACKELLADKSLAEEIIVETPAKNKFLRSIQKITQALRCRVARYDACFLLEEDAGSVRRLKTLGRIPVCAGASHRPNGTSNKAATHCTHVADTSLSRRLHMVEYYQHIVRSVLPAVALCEPYVPVLPVQSPDAAEAKSASGAKRVALCFEGSPRNPHKWPWDYCIALVRRLAADDCALFALVPESGVAFFSRLREVSGVNIESRVCPTVAACAAALREADLLVSIDTAQVHLAAVLDVPVLSLAGPTAATTYPRTTQGLALAASPGCHECPFIDDCKSNKKYGRKDIANYSPPCMRALAPDIVYQYSRALLETPTCSETYVVINAASKTVK